MSNNELQFNTFAVRWKKVGFEEPRFEETLMYVVKWELYSQTVSSGFKGISIDKCFFYGRKHPESNTREFLRSNPFRKASCADTILLVLDDLKKNIVSYLIKRYFGALSLDFVKYKLFENILNVLNLPTFEKLYWQLFCAILPLRLPIHRIKKGLKSRLK